MKTARSPMTYPFVSRREVADRLDRDPAFVRECVAILHRRFVDRDILPPPAGWMVSHRKAGEELHARLASDAATAGDVVAAAKIAKSYAKQLSKVFRDEQLARDPSLGLAAAVFGVRPPLEDEGRSDDPYASIDDEPSESVAVVMDPGLPETANDAQPAADDAALATAPMAEAEPAKRRRGRPKGSKSRPREERAKPGKRGRRS